MSQVPDVSVIIPVYNPGEYLRGCLDSVLGQTIGTDRLELIAVDDGSTDGSGEVLDRAAAAHPGVVRVVHQENSGGPATPCNVGLGLARGRYVYFLGSDDELGTEALERMVTAADAWGSDVLSAKIVGIGRGWSQQIYAENRPSMEFPSKELAGAMSNTKLFRRSLIEEHGIRYPLDLRIGSDQPFTFDALLAARRISALGDYEYYRAHRRTDDSNLTYSTGWRTRLQSIEAVMHHIASRLGPGVERDTVLQRHFGREIAKALRDERPVLDGSELHDFDDLVRGLCDTLLTDRIRAEVPGMARIRLALFEAGREEDLAAMVGAEDRVAPLGHDDRGWYRDLGLSTPLSRRTTAVAEDQLPFALRNATALVEPRFQDGRLVLTGHLSIPRHTLAAARVVARRVQGSVPGVSSHPTPPEAPSGRWWPVAIEADDAGVCLHVEVPTDDLPRGQDLSLRWQFDVGGTTYVAPVRCTADQGEQTVDEVHWRTDELGRFLLRHTGTDASPAGWLAPLKHRVLRRLGR